MRPFPWVQRRYLQSQSKKIINHHKALLISNLGATHTRKKLTKTLVRRKYLYKYIHGGMYANPTKTFLSCYHMSTYIVFSAYNSPMQKRESSGASFLYWLDWKSKHLSWNVLEWKVTQPSLRVFSEKIVQMGAFQKWQNAIQTLIFFWPVYPIYTHSVFWVTFEELPFCHFPPPNTSIRG